MAENAKTHLITIDLSQFKLHIEVRKKIELTLHFNSPSRRFYLSVIALVVNEMKKQGKITSIPLEGHHELLALLNDTVGGSAGSSVKENLLPRVYRKWQHALPNLEEAPLFKVLGRKKEYDESTGKTYPFTETEKDLWANLFEYMGSEENVRLKFALDKIGATLNDVVIVYEGYLNAEAWEKFILSLKKKGSEKQETELTMKYPLPDVPSIAVLPFVNLTGDPKQEFLGDSMTEEIITTLAKVPGLFVIARTSTSVYKGKPANVKQISEDLGVRYVLEGGIQRSGDRVRITVQLIDGLTGDHKWSNRYDRHLKDIFALQDEIAEKVLIGVQVKLEGGSFFGGEVSRAEKYAEKYYRGKQGLNYYLNLRQAFHYWERLNTEDNNLARRIAEETIAICPENPEGYLILGLICVYDYLLDNTNSPLEAFEKAKELARKTLAIDDSMGGAHTLLGWLYLLERKYDKAIAEGKRAVALNPSNHNDIQCYANTLTFAGRPEAAIPLFHKAIRLSPLGPAYEYINFGHALRMVGRHEEAVSAYRKGVQIAPERFDNHFHLAAIYSMMGFEKEARAEASELVRENPTFSLDSWAKKILLYKDQTETDKVVNALRKAGLK